MGEIFSGIFIPIMKFAGIFIAVKIGHILLKNFGPFIKMMGHKIWK